MESLEIISLYENVASLTNQMLNAARDRDWERLSVLESDCSLKVEAIKTADTPAPLSPELKERKIRVIKKILADDREIRDITEPWMTELSQLMRSSNTAMKVNTAYGTGSAA